MKILLLLLCVVPPWAVAAPAEPVADRIDCLLRNVAVSSATFVRNGKAHTGKEAADHLTKKYRHYEKDIKTVDDFIRLAGTRSLLTRRYYLIRSGDGRERRASQWLRELYHEKCGTGRGHAPKLDSDK